MQSTARSSSYISGGSGDVESWPKPIYCSADPDRCYCCLQKPIIAPVLLKCAHVICNPCLQNIMSIDGDISRCPICREHIYSYKSLRSNRIRRPRDKHVPVMDDYFDDPQDEDYVPTTNHNIGNQQEEAGESARPQSQHQPLVVGGNEVKQTVEPTPDENQDAPRSPVVVRRPSQGAANSGEPQVIIISDSEDNPIQSNDLENQFEAPENSSSPVNLAVSQQKQHSRQDVSKSPDARASQQLRQSRTPSQSQPLDLSAGMVHRESTPASAGEDQSAVGGQCVTLEDAKSEIRGVLTTLVVCNQQTRLVSSNNSQPGPQESLESTRRLDNQPEVPLNNSSALQFEVDYMDISHVEEYRGRGRNIRYLVVYEDGHKCWEPLGHMTRCSEALKRFRRRLKVKNQQAYRTRLPAKGTREANRSFP